MTETRTVKENGAKYVELPLTLLSYKVNIFWEMTPS